MSDRQERDGDGTLTDAQGMAMVILVDRSASQCCSRKQGAVRNTSSGVWHPKLLYLVYFVTNVPDCGAPHAELSCC